MPGAALGGLGDFLIDSGNRLNLFLKQRRSIDGVLEKTRKQFSSGDISKKVLKQTTSRLEKEAGAADRRIRKVLEGVIRKLLEVTK